MIAASSLVTIEKSCKVLIEPLKTLHIFFHSISGAFDIQEQGKKESCSTKKHHVTRNMPQTEDKPSCNQKHAHRRYICGEPRHQAACRPC